MTTRKTLAAALARLEGRAKDGIKLSRNDRRALDKIKRQLAKR
jgi:hypothetical protein